MHGPIRVRVRVRVTVGCSYMHRRQCGGAQVICTGLLCSGATVMALDCSAVGLRLWHWTAVLRSTGIVWGCSAVTVRVILRAKIIPRLWLHCSSRLKHCVCYYHSGYHVVYHFQVRFETCLNHV